jgi:hypothetical protein
MTPAIWVVCERKGRWAGALRAALSRTGWPPSSVPRLREVRQLAELSPRLESHADQLVLVEVERATFGSVLEWLASICRRHRGARVVALLNRDVWDSDIADSRVRRRIRRAAIDALFEAGASDVSTSPRQLQAILALGRRCNSHRSMSRDVPGAQLSIADAVWASLPWQDD